MIDKEFETKVLNINPEEIVRKLKELGAAETPEVLMRRYVFDIESSNIEFIRLRDNGQKTTLTYKYKVQGNTSVGETVEIEIEVSDFDKTAKILSKLAFWRIFYQENKAHIFRLNGIEFSINTWPMIDPFLEIEASSYEKVKEGLDMLGLDGKDEGDLDLKEIFKLKGIDIHSQQSLKFD